MTIPRRIIPGQNHMISRRCVQRRMLLTPCKEVSEVVLYALAVSARRHEILVHAVMVESNHYHLDVTDPRGKLPEFVRDFDQLVARALNVRYGRGEAFWCPGSYSNVEIHDCETLIEKLVYTITRVTDKHPTCWPDAGYPARGPLPRREAGPWRGLTLPGRLSSPPPA